MSSTSTPSGPPGPPPGPPPAPGTQKQDVTPYKRYLDAAGIKASESDLHEEERLRAGAWRFYYRGPVTQRAEQAAIDAQGRVVTIKRRDQWQALLSEPSLDAMGALERIAWLYGHAAAVGPNFPLKDPAVKQRVTPPKLDRSPSGEITFVGWLVFPPQMQAPYRVVVRAPKQGDATVELTELSKVSP